jgi:hypothetical protein
MINVFEHPTTAIREGGWLKLVSEAQAIPEDYGVAWRVWNQAVFVCAPMPFHTVLGWLHRLYWAWRVQWGCLPKTALDRAYLAGVDAERERAQRELDYRLKLMKKEHAMELKAAEIRGRREILDDLLSSLCGETRH